MVRAGFGFHDGDRDLAIRFGRHRDDFEKDRRAGRRSRPRRYRFPKPSRSGARTTGSFAISTRAYGEPLEQLSAVRLAHDAAVPVRRARRAAHHRCVRDLWLRRMGCERCAARLATWRDFLLSVDADTPDRRTYGWRERLAQSPVGDSPFDVGMARGSSSSPTRSRRTLRCPRGSHQPQRARRLGANHRSARLGIARSTVTSCTTSRGSSSGRRGTRRSPRPTIQRGRGGRRTTATSRSIGLRRRQ